MAREYSGTIQIGISPAEAVSAKLTKKGRNMMGTIIFDSDTSKTIPLTILIIGTDFTTPAAIYFTSPAGNIIKIDAIGTPHSSISAGEGSLSFSRSGTKDGVGTTIALSLTENSVLLDTPAYDAVDGPVSSETPRLDVSMTRINERGSVFDHFGSIVSLPRLPEEKNSAYLARLKDVVVHKANSSYAGLVNGITRELGLTKERAIEIRIRSSYQTDRQRVRFVLDESYATIYSTWIPDEFRNMRLVPVVEQQIELSTLIGGTIENLVDWINESEIYSAEVLSNGTASVFGLGRIDSVTFVLETLPPQEIMKLPHGNIVEGKITLSLDPSMDRQVSTPSAYGEWSLDSTNGILKAFTQPSSPLSVNYLTTLELFYGEYSPVQVQDLSADAVQERYFEQITNTVYETTDDILTNGLPLNRTYGILRKVLENGSFCQYWGE